MAHVTITRSPGGRGSVLRASTQVPRSLEETFAFFADARNLERVTPPSLRFRIVSDVGDGATSEGMLIDYRLRLRGVPIRWRTRITRFDAPHAFVDEQLRGPYRVWRHTHVFEADGPDRTRMIDTVEFVPRGGRPIARIVDRLFVAREVRGIFEWRAAALERLLPARS